MDLFMLLIDAASVPGNVKSLTQQSTALSLEGWYFVSQIVAACILFFTLIFVGWELRQNARAIRSASTQSVYNTWAVANIEHFRNGDQALLLSRLFDPNSQLSDFDKTELAQLHFIVRATIQLNMSFFHLYKEKSLSKERWEEQLEWMRGAIELPVFRMIVEREMASGPPDDEFFAELFSASALSEKQTIVSNED